LWIEYGVQGHFFLYSVVENLGALTQIYEAGGSKRLMGKVKVEVKVKVQPRTGHEGPEGE